MFAEGDQGTSVQMLSGITGTRGRGGDLQRRACDQNRPTCTSADFSPVGDRGGRRCRTHSLVKNRR